MKITANSCGAGSNELRESGDPVLDLYGIRPHNKGSEFDPSRKEKIKMDQIQEMRGDLREALSETLLRIRALERLDADKDLIETEINRANNCRKLLLILNKGE
jgi:hypothetical protein